MRRIFFAVLLGMVCATSAAAGSAEDADSALARMLRSRAEQGDAQAQSDLGTMYNYGRGVPQDYQEGLKWTRKAAKQGFGKAQGNLGVSYELGHGVPQDSIRAHMWLNVAAATLSGDDRSTAVKNRDGVASKMTAAQIGKAQEMARQCQETKFKECD